MRKFLLFITIGLMFSCSKDQLPLNNLEDSEILNKVKSLGFNVDNFRINGDTIIVEDDIILYKSKLLSSSPRQATVYPGPHVLAEFSKIKFYISPSLTGHTTIISALDEFSNAQATVFSIFAGQTMVTKTGISFQQVTSSANADLIISDYYQVSGTCGFAEFPTLIPSGNMVQYDQIQVGKNIEINNYHWNNLSDSQRKLLIAHEFGHAIGLRHTNWKKHEPQNDIVNGVSIGAYTVTNTPSGNNPDPNSVFNSMNCGHDWNGFTRYDVRAIFATTSFRLTLD